MVFLGGPGNRGSPLVADIQGQPHRLILGSAECRVDFVDAEGRSVIFDHASLLILLTHHPEQGRSRGPGSGNPHPANGP